jgi:hypothetical protein
MIKRGDLYVLSASLALLLVQLIPDIIMRDRPWRQLLRASEKTLSVGCSRRSGILSLATDISFLLKIPALFKARSLRRWPAVEE